MCPRNIQWVAPESPYFCLATQELQRCCPVRRWQLICVDETYDRVVEVAPRITTLLHPRATHLDFNVGTAFWFVGRGIGFVFEDDRVPRESEHVGPSVLRYGTRAPGKQTASASLNAHDAVAACVTADDVAFALHGWRRERGACSTEWRRALTALPPALESRVRRYNAAVEPFASSSITAVAAALDAASREPADTGRDACDDCDQPPPPLKTSPPTVRTDCAGTDRAGAGPCTSPAHRNCRQTMCRSCCLSVVDSAATVPCLAHRRPALSGGGRSHATSACDASVPGEVQSSPGARGASSMDAHRPSALRVPLPRPAVIVRSAARVLLSGIGADEMFGGYGRHRTSFRHGGWIGLQRELAVDYSRLWIRNLGRDDRAWSDHGREVRAPFLDEAVSALLRRLPLPYLCDLRLPPGVGDKRLLRVAARMLGLGPSTTLVKRAIHFGSRIAKQSNVATFGSNRAARGDAAFALPTHDG